MFMTSHGVVQEICEKVRARPHIADLNLPSARMFSIERQF